MNRDEDILTIRPVLELADKDKKPIELFQNKTLRPILKLQHEHTLAILNAHKNYNANLPPDTTAEQYDQYITKFIQTNIDLKNQLIGSVVGLFSSSELSYYFDQRKELNRRMIQMQIKRFVDAKYTNWD